VLGAADSRLYPIIDTQVCDARNLNPREVAAACLRGGAGLLQLRMKTGSSAAFLSLTDDVVTAAKAYGAIVVVNDRADIARMAGAGGVHVGQEDMSPAAVRAVFCPGLIGLSTHDEGQVDEALTSSAVDYVAVGPIYDTGTKNTGYSARGLDLVRYAAGRGKPVVAIGGIDLDRAPVVIAAGASMVAVIADLYATGNVETSVRAYIHANAP
jgi:thiamine-phosphate pyrophosphorylase